MHSLQSSNWENGFGPDLLHIQEYAKTHTFLSPAEMTVIDRAETSNADLGAGAAKACCVPRSGPGARSSLRSYRKCPMSGTQPQNRSHLVNVRIGPSPPLPSASAERIAMPVTTAIHSPVPLLRSSSYGSLSLLLCILLVSGFPTSGRRVSRHPDVGIFDIRISGSRHLSTGYEQLIDV